MSVVVVGIGQSLRGDDAVGLEAVRRWSEAFPLTAGRPDVRVELAGIPGLGLLDLLRGAQAAVLVDAVRSSAPVGTVHRLGPGELAAFSTGSSTAHGWGVAETLALAEELDLPVPLQNIRILGIEAGPINIGTGLSAEITVALPWICQAIEQEVHLLLG